MGLYEQDFYGWVQQQAALLKAGKLDELDTEHLLEEIEGMGKSEERGIESRLIALLAHLLKWQWQPDLRGKSWEATIRVQRHDIGKVLAKNPSLKSKVPDLFVEAYGSARLEAGYQTGYTEVAFPEGCPYTLEQALDPEFWPET
jgi:hypothetical protein